jgi:hypothetical protein
MGPLAHHQGGEPGRSGVAKGRARPETERLSNHSAAGATAAAATAAAAASASATSASTATSSCSNAARSFTAQAGREAAGGGAQVLVQDEHRVVDLAGEGGCQFVSFQSGAGSGRPSSCVGGRGGEGAPAGPGRCRCGGGVGRGLENGSRSARLAEGSLPGSRVQKGSCGGKMGPKTGPRLGPEVRQQPLSRSSSTMTASPNPKPAHGASAPPKVPSSLSYGPPSQIARSAPARSKPSNTTPADAARRRGAARVGGVGMDGLGTSAGREARPGRATSAAPSAQGGRRRWTRDPSTLDPLHLGPLKP